MKEKKCSKCGKVKPIEDFIADVNGEVVKCRQCLKCRMAAKVKKPKNNEFWFDDFIYGDK